jgi:GTP-binding protein
VGEAAWDGLRVSAVTGEGVRPLVGRLATMVAEARAEAPVSEAFVVHRPVPEGVVVDRDDDGAFRVHGRSAERAVAVSDLTNADALAFVHSRLKRLGIDRALRRAGAHDGDTVRIGDLSFDYEGT